MTCRSLLAATLMLLTPLAGCTGLGLGAGPTGPLTSGGDLVSNNAGSIVSNNSGSLTGVFRAPEQLVSNNAGSLVSNNSGSYRIGALSEKAVPGATVAAFDLSGNRFSGTEARTAADGRFTINVPPNRPVVLKATLSQSGKDYVFQSVGVSADKATGSADLNAGTTLATESLLRLAAQKGLDLRSLVAARLAALSSLLGGAFDDSRVGVLSEGKAALLDYTNSLMAANSDLRFLASVLNGYTGLAFFDGTLTMADNTRGTLLRRTSGGAFTPWLGGLGESFADGPSAAARFASVYGMIKAPDGTLYFADAGNHRIRAVSPSGEVSTVAGGTVGAQDGAGTAAQFRFPTSLALSEGALFVTDTGNDLIRRIDLATRQVTTVAGGSARLWTPRSLVADDTGTLYYIESSISEIRRLLPNGDGSYRVETFAGGYGRNYDQWSILDGPASVAAFNLPMAMTYHDHALYVADTMSHAIRKVDLVGAEHVVETLAGGGTYYAGNLDATGRAARFRGPDSVAVAPDGTVYVGDGGNLALRAIAPSGAVQTVAVTVQD